MKPRIGVYLSEQMAARLAAAAKRPGASKSALVEAALAQFFGSDDDSDNLPVDRRLSHMSRQLEELDRGLRIVNETVALQARFHLSVTPVLPAADQRAACALGSERFDEFAAQVGRRVRLGTSLDAGDDGSAQHTETRGSFEWPVQRTAEDHAPQLLEPDLRTSNPVGIEVEQLSAVREGGSLFNFPGKAGLPLH